MGDRRSTPRKSVSKAASAITTKISTDCTVEEISKTGARLRLGYATANLPLKFILKFSEYGLKKTVTLVWRKGAVVAGGASPKREDVRN